MTPENAKPWRVDFNRSQRLIRIARNDAHGLAINVEQAVSLMEQLREAIDRVHAAHEGVWETVDRS